MFKKTSRSSTSWPAAPVRIAQRGDLSMKLALNIKPAPTGSSSIGPCGGSTRGCILGGPRIALEIQFGLLRLLSIIDLHINSFSISTYKFLLHACTSICLISFPTRYQ
uniref:Uncharacterized protein n=1 Tax=Arundo donax TaxID=35708 RepID=A0A0A9A8I2_ARUDO